ncbi:uncharacterized protein PV09_09733 [Verruconis gallopava]|uniref:Uncharacterized protein n=1 Tax=Verruconis gallopava TaxID=253628 RepID=A0A0D1ZWR2_9PEZI|nr:uncharacterized protein PV09_09733 [Verruconis gallopava]KIV98454.1 hypothetical protein PV09_09733 [Verruconis gallopava]
MSRSTFRSLGDFGGVSRATYFRHKAKRAHSEIELHREIAAVACQNYFKYGIRCVFMSGTKSVKCASCASKGIACLNSSWASLDKTREEARSQIDADLQELERITARLKKNRKILKLAEARAKAKAVYLLDELEEEEEMQRVKNGGLSNAELEELSKDLIVQNNILPQGPPIWSAWDPDALDRSLKRRRLEDPALAFPSSEGPEQHSTVASDPGFVGGTLIASPAPLPGEKEVPTSRPPSVV